MPATVNLESLDGNISMEFTASTTDTVTGRLKLLIGINTNADGTI
jgi:hypothetical protein